MRLKIHLRGGGVVPFDYHYHLSAAMYRFKKIANEYLATELHYSRDIKLFTFSEIMIPNRKITSRGIEMVDDYAYMIYSSPHKEYVKAVIEGMLSNPELIVGNNRFDIESIEVLPEPEVNWNDVVFKTLSPICVYTSYDGKKKTPLYPTDTRWYVNLEKNIRHKYETVNGEAPKKFIKIETLHFKPKRYLFEKRRNGKKMRGYIYAVHGKFRFSGEPELIRLAYEAGAGERGALGFGCLEIYGDRDSKMMQR